MIVEKAGLLEEESVQMLNHPFAIPASTGGPLGAAVVPAGNPLAEKRREARYETCEAVEVCILEVESQPLRGILRDVSRSGLRIELSLPVEAGSHLEIVLLNRAIIFGEARYCRGSGHTYHVGVVIEDIYYPKSDPAASTQDERRRRNAAQPWFDKRPAAGSAEAPGPDRLALAQTVFSRKFIGYPVAQGPIRTHVSPDDAAAFLHHELSETKTALIARHLVACQECSILMRMILEDSTSFIERSGNATAYVQSGFGRVMLPGQETPR